jgi:hypothetical protein
VLCALVAIFAATACSSGTDTAGHTAAPVSNAKLKVTTTL